MIPPPSSALLAAFRANCARNVIPLFRPARANDGAQRVVFFRAPRHGDRRRAYHAGAVRCCVLLRRPRARAYEVVVNCRVSPVCVCVRVYG